MKPTKEEFEAALKTMIRYVEEDPDREGLQKTPSRVRKAYEKMYEGYTKDPLKILRSAMFESTNSQMVLVRDIEFYSTCEHHLLPIIGRVHLAYIPDTKVVGLSKIPRLIEVFARRMQIQEQMTEQIANAFNDAISPKGVAVMVHARHMCMEMRGVEKVHSTTSTSAYRGVFSKSKMQEEFMQALNVSVPSFK